ncbi:hypothetical protein QTP88_021360 [Uroleucon formosanum]
MGRKIQKDLALELCNMLPEYNEKGFTLKDIKNGGLALDIQINVICAENLNTLIFKGEDKVTKIYLYKNGNHFDIIKSATFKYCYNQECLDNHEYLCLYVYKCIDCSKLLFRDREHKSGYSKCRNCLEEVKINEHQCHMQRRLALGEKYLFFDYETQQETGTHIANKIIAHDFEGNKIIFDTNEKFCKHVISDEYRGYTLIAHYAKGYDSQFILKYLVDNTLKPFTIYNGTKLMLLQIKYLSIRIIDSSNFIQGPLSSFPKTFGLKELKKGYFPHLFNTVENQNYIGILPDKKYYRVETMKTENKIEFEKWNNEKINENYLFNFKEELVAYCNSDVDILRRGCLKLRKQFLDIANIDPFCYTTIAGVCMRIYRSKYLLEDTTAVLDKEKNESYSKQSITWLQNFNTKNISHALNGDRETINNINHETMDDLYQKTIEKGTAIKNAGYNIVEQWECDLINSIIYKKMKKADIADPINPRDAFFGGRTNATKLRLNSTRWGKLTVVILGRTYIMSAFLPIRSDPKLSVHRYPMTSDVNAYNDLDVIRLTVYCLPFYCSL